MITIPDNNSSCRMQLGIFFLSSRGPQWSSCFCWSLDWFVILVIQMDVYRDFASPALPPNGRLIQHASSNPSYNTKTDADESNSAVHISVVELPARSVTHDATPDARSLSDKKELPFHIPAQVFMHQFIHWSFPLVFLAVIIRCEESLRFSNQIKHNMH